MKGFWSFLPTGSAPKSDGTGRLLLAMWGGLTMYVSNQVGLPDLALGYHFFVFPHGGAEGTKGLEATASRMRSSWPKPSNLFTSQRADPSQSQPVPTSSCEHIGTEGDASSRLH